MVDVQGWYGPINPLVIALNGKFAFVGPTTTLTLPTTRRIVASAALVIGSSAGGSVAWQICLRNTVSPEITAGEFIVLRLQPGEPAAIGPVRSGSFGAGTYEVGVCVAGYGGDRALNINDYVRGWIMVLN